MSKGGKRRRRREHLKSPSFLPGALQSQLLLRSLTSEAFISRVMEMLLIVIIGFCWLALPAAADLCNWTGR